MSRSNMPKIQVALNPWLDNLTFIKITQNNEDFLTEETEEVVFFQGTVQPFGPAQLSIKPTGERSWDWWMVHSLTALALTTGDKITLEGQNYKVMSNGDYSRNAFYEYHLVRNFEAAA